MKIDLEINKYKTLIESVKLSIETTDYLLDLYESRIDENKITKGVFVPSLELRFAAANATYQLIDMRKRLEKLEADLKNIEASRSAHLVAFEKESRECNLNIEDLFKRATRAAHNAAEGVIKEAIKNLLNSDYTQLDQEAKNDLYFELKRLVNQIKK